MNSPFLRKVATLVLGFGLAFSGMVKANPADDMERAIAQDNEVAAKRLLEQGVSPNALTTQGLPVLYSAIKKESYRVAAVLAGARGLQVNQASPKDETALMMAAFRGQMDLAKQLIVRGADVNRPGWTPLHYAATNGHVPMIGFLLAQDADINARSPNNTTPLMMAAMYGSEDAATALLNAGADAARKNQVGMTAADFARKAERAELAKKLEQAAAKR